MKLGPISIEMDSWNRKNAFWRILALLILGAWVTWGLVIYQEGAEIEARIQAAYAEQARKAEMQRHQNEYERLMKEQQNMSTGTGNIMDMLPEEKGE